MLWLILGIVVFFGVHFLPAASGLRGRLVAALGEGGYKGVFSLLSAVGLGLLIYGKAQAPYEHLYAPIAMAKPVAGVLTLLAFYLLVGRKLGSIANRFTAHPMLWGISLWAIAHLLANGDLGSVLLFGSFLLYSLLDMWLANRRGATPKGAVFSLSREALIVALTLLVYGALVYFHGWLFARPLLP
ncbi:MAG: NnrU family protein [Pseudomonadota bacterium]